MTDKEFSKLDPIVPESDERIGRGRAGPSSQPPRSADSRTTETRKSGNPPRNVDHGPKGSTGFIWKFLVLVLIFGLGGLGYFFVEQIDKLSQLQGRFDELEAKIVSTDESLNQSGTTLSVKLAALGDNLKEQDQTLDKHWSEIKKLWGVSNDRNRKKIQAQEKTLVDQGKTVKGLQTSMSARKKDIASLTTKVDKASQSMETVVNASLAAKLEMNDLVEQSQQTNDQLNRLEKSIEQLKQNLNSRVADNEEAINAIDAYRLQVNRDIQLLKQQLSPTSAGGSSASP